MMRINSSFFLALTALAMSALSLQAQTTLNTVPEGMLTLNVTGSPSGNTTSYFSLPLNADPVYTGAVATGGVTANTITTVDASPFVNSAVGVQLASLTTPGLPYFVKFLSGAQSGRTIRITANTTNTLTLDTTDNTNQTVSLLAANFSVAAGDTFEVFPAATLGSLFGDNTSGNPVALTGSSSPFLADTVGIYNPSLLKLQVFFFNTSAGYWEASGTTTNANNTVIAPYSALSILRRAGGASISISPMARESSIASSGGTAANILVPMSRVPEVASLTKANTNSVVYGSTCYPVNLTLSQILGSQTNNNWIQGSSPFTADTLSFYSTASSKFLVYYENGGHWYQSGVANTVQDSVVIPAGSEVIFRQRGTAGADGTAFLSSILPYTLN